MYNRRAMTYRTEIKGSLVALVTPMSADGTVDYPCLDRLIEWHIEQGTDAIVSVGTTGESATLGVAEHLQVIQYTINKVAKRIPVIAGTGANATAEAQLLTREAFSVGADACLLVTPYYNKPTQEGLYRHYAAIAENADGPLILYNVPGRTACDLKPETVARLLPCEAIVGIKEATGTLERIKALVELDPGFVVYTGDDATACASMLIGARGDVSVTANVAPAQMHQMCMAAINGDRELAMSLDADLAGLHQHLFAEPNPIPVKWALNRMGRIPEGIRLPMTPLAEEFYPLVEKAMAQAGVSF